MSENELLQDNEISLLDLFNAFKEGWRWLVGSVVFGGIGAGVFLVLSSPQYEAVALVQVGQVSGEPVEPQVQAVERIKSSSFQLKVAEASGDLAWQNRLRDDAASAKGPLAVQVIKNSPGLIELKASGGSVQNAQKIAEATLSELAKKHAELAAPTLTRMKTELAIVREELVKAEAEVDTLLKSLSSVSVRDDRFTQLALINSLHEQKRSEILSLRQQVLHLTASLSEPSTQPARAIEQVFAPERPVAPKKGLALALGLVIGLMFGGISLLVRNALKKR